MTKWNYDGIYPDNSQEPQQVVCPQCKGSGKVWNGFYPNNHTKEINCPTCNSTGKVPSTQELGQPYDKSVQMVCPKGGEHEWRTDGLHSNQFCGKCFISKPVQSVSTPTEGMELSKQIARISEMLRANYGMAGCITSVELAKNILSNLPTEQDTRIKNLEIQLKNWQEFYVADVNHQRRSNMQKVICPNPCIDFPQCKDRIPHLPDNDWCQRPCDIVEGVGKCIPIPESDEDIRKSERMKIGSWLENETRGVNFGAWAYWWNSVIAKLKSGQKVDG